MYISVTKHGAVRADAHGARLVLPALRAAVPLPPSGNAPRHVPKRRAVAIPVSDLRVPRQYTFKKLIFFQSIFNAIYKIYLIFLYGVN